MCIINRFHVQLQVPEPPTILPPTENEDGQLSGGEEQQIQASAVEEAGVEEAGD